MRDERTFEKVKEPLTESEISAMKDELVTLIGEVRALRDEKLQAASVLGTSLKTAEKKIFDIQAELNQGFKLVEIEVFAVIDPAEPEVKKIVQVSTGKTLRTVPATAYERQQQSFGFEQTEEGKE